MAQLNAKAMHTLFCALGPSEYNRVSLCDNAKQVWDKLATTHEGTNQVKESKISMLTLDYELFKMKTDETIKEMSDRFTDVINGLKALGKTYPNKEMVKKLLNSLPKSWEAKVTAIEESKDPNTLSLDELIGSLLTYEMKIKHGQEPSKKASVAFKSTTPSDDEEEVEEDEEMAMFAKRFNKFMRMNKARRPPRKEIMKGDSSKKEKEPIICYECKKPGHIKFECPMWKKSNLKKQKKKAMVATWSDSDTSDNDEEEVANLCLMAHDEPKVLSNANTYSFDELQDAFDELALEFEAMNLKYKKMNSKLKEENKTLSMTNSNLIKKVDELQVNVDDLTIKNKNLHNSFTKFYMSQQKLNDMLETQRAFFDKNGLGYNRIEKETHFKNFFMTQNKSFDTSSICTNCHKLGHTFHTCSLKTITFRGKLVRRIWIPKGISTSQDETTKLKWITKGTKILSTNTQGPKKIWVPKKKT